MDLLFKFRSLIGTDRKHWPVTVRKFEQYGDGLRETAIDRGRRVIDTETDDPVYEFKNESDTTLPISQEDLRKGPDGNPLLEVLKVQTEDGPMYAPLERNLEITAGEIEDLNDKDLDMKFITKMSRFINIGKKEIERHYEITKTEERAWYEQPMFLMIGGFLGLGLFMVFAGIAYSNMINEETLNAIDNLREGILPALLFEVKNRNG